MPPPPAALPVPPTALPDQPARERWLPAIAWGAAGVLLVVLAWPLLHGAVYTKDDLGNLHLPWRAFYAACLRQGDRFLWCPGLFGGYDLYGLGEAGMAHPMHWLLYRWLPLALAFNLEGLLTYAGLLAGGYLFLRRWLADRTAAVFGAGAFTFCGFNFLHFMHLDMVAVVAHLPWLLWCADLLLRAPQRHTRIWAGLGITLFTASQLLLGHPQAFVWSAMAETLYVVVLTAGQRAWRAPLAWTLAKALGGLVGAVQLLPTWAFIQTTGRAHSGSGFASVQSLHPINLVQLVCPYLLHDGYYPNEAGYLHEFGAYAGIAVAALALGAVLAVRELPRAARPLWWFGLLLVVVGLTLALGHYAGVQPLLARLPAFGLFKSPCRHLVLAHLGLAILAAILLAQQQAHRALGLPRPRRAWLAPLLLLAASAGATWLLPFTAYPLTADWRIRLAMPLLALLAGAALLAAWRHAAAVALLVVLTFADLGCYGLRYLRTEPVNTVAEFAAARLQPPPDFAGRLLSSYNPFLLLGGTIVDGLGGVQPQRLVPLINAKVWRLHGVRWVHSSNLPRLQHEDAHWVLLEDTLPRARLVAATVAPAADLPRQVAQLDLAQIAIVELPQALPSSPPGGDCVVVSDRPGSIQVQTNAPGDRVLVLTERWAPGWQVRIDGAPGLQLRAYGDLLGAVVPVGAHLVELNFDPPAVRRGGWLTGCGLLLTALWLLVQLRHARPRPLENSAVA